MITPKFGGTPAVPRKLFASTSSIGNARTVPQLQERVFIVAEDWIAPVTTIRLEYLNGVGASGTPRYTGGYWYQTRIVTEQWGPNGSNPTSSTRYVYYTPGRAPTDQCAASQGSDGSGNRTCEYYTEYYDPPTSATRGADAQAFGYTFDGGFGGAGTPVTVNDPPFVAPGGTYQIRPNGGRVTIRYYA